MDLKTVNGSLGLFKKGKSLPLLYTGENNRSTIMYNVNVISKKTYQCDALISKYLIILICIPC